VKVPAVGESSGWHFYFHTPLLNFVSWGVQHGPGPVILQTGS
jgi:hypothetical protein